MSETSLTFAVEVLSLFPIQQNIISSLFISTDITSLRKLSQRKDIFPTLVNSVSNVPCSPMIKYAVLLAMLSNRMPIHILIISERNERLNTMIPFITNIYKRSIVVEDLTSKASLESTAKKEEKVMRGSVSQANGGLLIIDNPDILRRQEGTLLECIETGKERIDGFGLIDTHFSSISFIGVDEKDINDLKREAKNIQDISNLSIQLMWCFTLICFVDADTSRSFKQFSRKTAESFDKWSDTSLTLERRLTSTNLYQNIKDEVFSSYMEYARGYIDPIINEEVENMIRTYSTELSNKMGLWRVEEHMRSLVVARAAAELRNFVNSSDVEEVNELMWWFADRVSITNKSNEISTKRSSFCKKKKHVNSKKSIIMEFLSIVEERSKKSSGKISRYEMNQIFNEVDGNSKFMGVEEIIDLLSAQGNILKCGNGDYRLA